MGCGSAPGRATCAISVAGSSVEYRVGSMVRQVSLGRRWASLASLASSVPTHAACLERGTSEKSSAGAAKLYMATNRNPARMPEAATLSVLVPSHAAKVYPLAMPVSCVRPDKAWSAAPTSADLRKHVATRRPDLPTLLATATSPSLATQPASTTDAVPETEWTRCEGRFCCFGRRRSNFGHVFQPRQAAAPAQFQRVVIPIGGCGRAGEDPQPRTRLSRAPPPGSL